MADFKERFTLLRKEKRMTQREIAQKLNLTHGTVGLYESGMRKPSSEKLDEIADFFNVSLDYLTGKSDIRKNVLFSIDNDGNVETTNLSALGIKDEDEAERYMVEKVLYKKLGDFIGLTEDELNEVKNYVKYVISKRG